MKIWKSRITKVITLLVVLAIIIFVGGRYVAFHLIEKKVKESIRNLEEDGIAVTFDSLYSDPWKGSVSLKGLKATVAVNRKDSADSVVSRIAGIDIEGIELLPIIFHRRIVIQSVFLDQPDIHLAENFHLARNNGKPKAKIRGFSIHHLNITGAVYELLDSISLSTSKRIQFNRFNAMNIGFEHAKDNVVRWNIGTTDLDTTVINLAKEMYTIRIQHTGYSATDKVIMIDSIKIIPDYDKHLFASKAVRQIDRIQATIPFIKGSGCEINKTSNSSFNISQLSLAVNIAVFRDKRYPFHNKTKRLPERFLHSLPIALQVDTLLLKDSYVSYEEFPEKGDSAGRVFFDHLHASLYNLSNTSTADAKMDAEADFMDAGKLQVHFTFPANPANAYHASGTLTNFSLPKINSMLEPLANARIQSGKMEEMKFHFEYNDYRSDGEVVLNYTDLKMESRNKSNLGNKIVTLLLNTFIRNNMDKHTDTAKKTGTILFYRDPQRAIFNYWWKSLLSGIKSVYNLDKITNTSSNKKK